MNPSSRAGERTQCCTAIQTMTLMSLRLWLMWRVHAESRDSAWPLEVNTQVVRQVVGLCKSYPRRPENYEE